MCSSPKGNLRYELKFCNQYFTRYTDIYAIRQCCLQNFFFNLPFLFPRDPYSKGVDSDFLKATLASRGTSLRPYNFYFCFNFFKKIIFILFSKTATPYPFSPCSTYELSMDVILISLQYYWLQLHLVTDAGKF